MTTTVIYHSADFDGLFCREIARKFCPPDSKFIGWDFGDPPLPLPLSGTVYVMDLPLDRVFGQTVLAIDGGKLFFLWEAPPPESIELGRVIWIDHHKSAIESHPEIIPGYRIDGVAACRLAWQWFTIADGNTPRSGAEIGIPVRPAGVLPMVQDFKSRIVMEPLAVRLAGEYDVFDKRDPNAEIFQHGLRSVPLTDGIWEELLEPKNLPNLVDDLLGKGISLKFAQGQEYEKVITQQGFDVEFEGIKFLACNSHELDIRSQLFAAGIKPHHEALLGFTFSGRDWRVSMYGLPARQDLDLSEIAKKHGGGGHRHACGFRCKRLPFWHMMG